MPRKAAGRKSILIYIYIYIYIYTHRYISVHIDNVVYTPRNAQKQDRHTVLEKSAALSCALGAMMAENGLIKNGYGC